MKLDMSREVEALRKFSVGARRFGEGAQKAGQIVTGLGCAIMLLGMIGLAIVVLLA